MLKSNIVTNLFLNIQSMFDTLEADVVIMQEMKIQRKDLQDDMVLIPGWDVFFSFPKHKKGELTTFKIYLIISNNVIRILWGCYLH